MVLFSSFLPLCSSLLSRSSHHPLPSLLLLFPTESPLSLWPLLSYYYSSATNLLPHFFSSPTIPSIELIFLQLQRSIDKTFGWWFFLASSMHLMLPLSSPCHPACWLQVLAPLFCLSVSSSSLFFSYLLFFFSFLFFSSLFFSFRRNVIWLYSYFRRLPSTRETIPLRPPLPLPSPVTPYGGGMQSVKSVCSSEKETKRGRGTCWAEGGREER